MPLVYSHSITILPYQPQILSEVMILPGCNVDPEVRMRTMIGEKN